VRAVELGKASRHVSGSSGTNTPQLSSSMSVDRSGAASPMVGSSGGGSLNPRGIAAAGGAGAGNAAIQRRQSTAMRP
jgi:hypothetical protein